jgi:sensor c-di-GMP phosphodiesterase-like protein
MMPMQQRRRIAITALALLGAILGSIGGYWLGRASLLRTASNGLSDYSGDLIAYADVYERELGTIWKAFNPSQFPFCSDEEIAEMQTLTFRSLQVKEVGRTHDGKLYCSAFLGRLNPALPAMPVTMLLPNGVKVYSDVPLKFVASARGTVLEFKDVSMVLSPNAFDYWGRPHMRYMVAIVNRNTNETAPIAGDKLHVDSSWMLAGGEKRTPSELYRSRCSLGHAVCVVTTETVHDVMQGAGSLLAEYSMLGSVAGFGLCLAIGQFYLQRVGVAQQLRRALREGALQLVYQPILELPSRRWAGAEALVRWSDEDGNPIAPDFFVRVAEERGFVGEITTFVVRRATQEVGDILRENPELTLSINIAASDLENDGLFWLLEEHVRQAGILPQQIALELTERSTVDLDILREAVLHFHREGYQVHIDDFGTGFSSLAYLHELAVDAIKIDRTFTRTIGTDAITASILPQILSLAESLQLEVIVEGVETEAQAEYLISTGKFMQAQGWYFGRPVAASELPKYREQMQSI